MSKNKTSTNVIINFHYCLHPNLLTTGYGPFLYAERSIVKSAGTTASTNEVIRKKSCTDSCKLNGEELHRQLQIKRRRAAPTAANQTGKRKSDPLRQLASKNSFGNESGLKGATEASSQCCESRLSSSLSKRKDRRRAGQQKLVRQLQINGVKEKGDSF